MLVLVLSMVVSHWMKQQDSQGREVGELGGTPSLSLMERSEASTIDGGGDGVLSRAPWGVLELASLHYHTKRPEPPSRWLSAGRCLL
jgi:hypothetical protein